jgi:beta-glucosidase
VKRFATFNEPGIFSLFARSLGQRDHSREYDYHRMIHHVNLAHGAALDVLRAKLPDASIGCIHNYQPCFASSTSDADTAAAEVMQVYWSKAYPDVQILGEYPAIMQPQIEPHLQPGDLARICRPLDWFGLNHYSPVYAKADPTAMLGFWFGDNPTDIPQTPIGWPIVPDAFAETLRTIDRDYGLPIYVTENGLGAYDKPDASGAVIDSARVAFLRGYISAMNSAAKSGVDVRGYFVWSLLDNFEWDQGYTNRFGLTYVDYQSQARIPKSSFHWYADLIRAARPR